MDTTINISVVIPAYNCQDTIIPCLNSVIDQTCPVYEIIIVDDGSTDNTATILSEYEADHPLVKIEIVSITNAGSSAARNKGINLATSEWIAFIDTDDRWLANKIEKQLMILRKHPDYKLIATLSNDNGNRYCGEYECVTFHKLLFRNSIITSTVIIDKAILKAFMFDEKLKYSEDYKLWLQVSRFNKVIVLREKLIIYGDDQPIYIRRSLSSHYLRMGMCELSIYWGYLRTNVNKFIICAALITSFAKYIRRIILFAVIYNAPIRSFLRNNRNKMTNASPTCVPEKRNVPHRNYDVSVIVTTYKRSEFVIKALISLSKQTFRNFDIIVVDDNGEGTEEQQKTERNVALLNLSRCRYMCLDHSSGAAVARNYGASMSKSPFIAFMDDDDEWENTKLEEQFKYINEQSSLCYCRQVEVGENSRSHKWRRLVLKETISRIYEENIIGNSSNPLINKQIFDSVGGFDIQLESCQDWDLWTRIIEVRPPIFVNQLLVFVDRNSIERISADRRKVLSGHLCFYEKHMSYYRKHMYARLVIAMKIIKHLICFLIVDSGRKAHA